MKNPWYKYFVYLSLGFLAVALYKADYLRIPHISHPSYLIPAFLFLFAGFVGTGISWCKILLRADYAIDLSECMAGVGLTIFGKYIPGKFWMILGRATYAADGKQKTLGKLSAVSLNAQIITIWIGLVMGSTGLFAVEDMQLLRWSTVGLLGVITLVLFAGVIHRFAGQVLGKLLRRDVAVPLLRAADVFPLLPWFTATWCFWSAGFFFLAQSLLQCSISWHISLGFPLAATLGILAIFTPGGLGAREGVMVAYLKLAGISVQDAVIVAVASRLWFLAGEIFAFVLGWLAHRYGKRHTPPGNNEKLGDPIPPGSPH